MIIAGDFNVDYSKQDTLGYKFFKQTLDPYNVTQIINLPTRTTSNTSTIIDHIYVSHSLVSPDVYAEDMSKIRN
jgi:endonuclease/exonuclease/phosphatase family metal-dependent hydrolase